MRYVDRQYFSYRFQDLVEESKGKCASSFDQGCNNLSEIDGIFWIKFGVVCVDRRDVVVSMERGFLYECIDGFWQIVAKHPNQPERVVELFF